MTANKNAEIVNKLTLKTIGCGKTAVQEATAKDKENAVLLATFIGICEKTKPGQVILPDGTVNEFVKLNGQFQAVNALTGEVYQSNVCLMPPMVADQIAKANSDSGGDVEFAVQLLARYSEKAATNYMFSAKPLLEAKPSDKMAALLEKAGNVLSIGHDSVLKPAADNQKQEQAQAETKKKTK